MDSCAEAIVLVVRHRGHFDADFPDGLDRFLGAGMHDHVARLQRNQIARQMVQLFLMICFDDLVAVT